MNIVALHGFLGKPSDWDGFFNEDRLQKIDLFNSPSIPSAAYLKDAARFFNEQTNLNGPKMLLGYSLGGRFALHALIDSPTKWQAAVIVSAHPGLREIQERQMRLSSDALWAKRFESEPWDSLMESWNSQAVFNQKKPPWNRQEIEFNRASLSNALKYWSLGHQENLKPLIETLPMPILWVSGEEDLKAVTAAQDINLLNKKSQIWIAPKASHRVPWEAKKQFLSRFNQFRETL